MIKERKGSDTFGDLYSPDLHLWGLANKRSKNIPLKRSSDDFNFAESSNSNNKLLDIDSNDHFSVNFEVILLSY
jgi:hypothetical protein